jgi:hypothetical protein
MFHLSLYALTPPGAPFSLLDVPAVEDSVITIVNRHPIFQTPIELINWYANGSVDISRVVLQTPKVRVIQNPSLRPFDAAAVPSTRNFFPDYRRHPLHLNAIDENQMLMSGSAGTGAAYVVAAWFGDGQYAASAGDVLTVHAVTPALTTPALTYASATFSIDTPLPAGQYTVVGMDAYAAGLDFARLIFPGQQPYPWRPGVVCGQDPTFQGGYCFRFGALGNYGSFMSYAQPQIETFSYAGLAGVPVDLFLDLIKTG